MNRRKRLTRWMVPAALLMAILTIAPPAPAAGGSPVTIRNIEVSGTRITISLANSSSESHAVTVFLRVFVPGGWQDLSARVTVPGGGTAQAQSTAQAPPVSVLPLGVVLDDGVPF